MTVLGAIWGSLSVSDRELLVFAIRPNSTRLAQFEAKQWWPKLLPSTQEALALLDWNAVLGRNVV